MMQHQGPFDRQQLRKYKNRIASEFREYDFLFHHACNILFDRLQDIKRTFQTALVLGGRTSEPFIDQIRLQHPGISIVQCDHTPSFLDQRADYNVVCEDDMLPFGQGSFDLILCPPGLHTANDLPGALIQLKYALKPDGLFLGALFGGETLYEFRDSLNKAEMALSGGLSPRIYPFADKPQMGNLMQRAGFSLPVVDSDIVSVTYPDLKRLMHDLRGMGEHNIISERKTSFTPKSLFDAAEDHYRDHYSDPADGRLLASFELIYLTGWSPHDSQQKPLRPGSAEHRLADELGTKEHKTGDLTGNVKH